VVAVTVNKRLIEENLNDPALEQKMEDFTRSLKQGFEANR